MVSNEEAYEKIHAKLEGSGRSVSVYDEDGKTVVYVRYQEPLKSRDLNEFIPYIEETLGLMFRTLEGNSPSSDLCKLVFAGK